jgi:hypothetical protein
MFGVRLIGFISRITGADPFVHFILFEHPAEVGVMTGISRPSTTIISGLDRIYLICTITFYYFVSDEQSVGFGFFVLFFKIQYHSPM